VVYRFEAELPADVSDDIDARTTGWARGFGSVRVLARIGTTSWSTSVFPDSKRKAYVLPVKKAVRVGEAIDAGDRVEVELRLSDAGST
jgi:hypothetical protein